MRSPIVKRPWGFAARELTGRRVAAVYRIRENGLRARVVHNTADVAALDQSFLSHFHEPPPGALARLQQIGRPLRALDVGANVGLWGLWLHSRMVVERLHGIEADPVNVARHRHQITLNGLEDRWTVAQRAVTVTDGPVSFLSREGSRGSIVDGAQDGAFTVEGIDVFSLLDGLDLLKIDIEGGEWPIVADPRFQDLGVPVVMLEYHAEGAPGDPRRSAECALQEAGYVTETEAEFRPGYGTVWGHRPSPATRQYVKLCDRRDFYDPALRAMLRSVTPGLDEQAELHRKNWEYAMLCQWLTDTGALSEDAEALGVAAGQEPPLFWLANRIKRVVATDIYGEGSFSYREAGATMLSDPASLAPYPYREDHLEVRHMDALALDFPDESFDIAFCLSSIEHFGGGPAAARAATEMARVLRPGGRLVITTECLLGCHLLDVPMVNYAIRLGTGGRLCANSTPTKRAIDAFTPSELDRYIVRPLAATGHALVQPLNLELSPESHENLITWEHGELRSRTGAPYPHIVLRDRGAPWTSVFLAFVKSR